MNTNHVAIHEDFTCNWVFVLPVESETCSDQVDEISSICRSIFESFGDFIRPLKITYNIQSYPAGTKLPITIEKTDDRLETSNITLIDDEKISLEELLTPFHPSDSESTFVGRIQFEKVAVKIRLQSGDKYVSGDNDTIEYVSGTEVNSNSTDSPLYIEIYYSPEHTQEDVDSESVYFLKVKTKTDIWFAESDISDTNADRLSNFLGRIESTLPVEKIVRDSNHSVSISTIY